MIGDQRFGLARGVDHVRSGEIKKRVADDDRAERHDEEREKKPGHNSIPFVYCSCVNRKSGKNKARDLVP